jgi:hypothetical protein
LIGKLTLDNEFLERDCRTVSAKLEEAGENEKGLRLLRPVEANAMIYLKRAKEFNESINADRSPYRSR